MIIKCTHGCAGDTTNHCDCVISGPRGPHTGVGMAPLALVLVKSMAKWYYVLCMYYVHITNTQLLLGNSCCVCL